ncbi:cinnamoyl-CoA reductase-like SNL6 [Coffea eugenioides]|uniref:cinnamoyl-CoA reductase-like SNL6 n=1 Tax=Coffea eugenioides TaxID=49369 RepID=UPI000F606DA4|nr:cinnamoyl-CoA reductase-like SNL6 [Coffea eugenioides]
MGIVRIDESQRLEIQEFRRMLLSCAGLHPRKGEDNNDMRHVTTTTAGENDDSHPKLVCVTSGVSFLGIAIVNQLLLRGYSVRLIVHNQEDVEKVREIKASEEMRGSNNMVEAVMANLSQVESLIEAFEGCGGVFHTAAFVDPAGLSGYSKTMAQIEVKATKNIVEACAAASSVRQCVLTSSLLACVWQDKSINNTSLIIDQKCWSDESVCIDKKLWYALGKLRAEKAAWELAKERGLKLATICPGLVTGPEFHYRSLTSTIAYLKGAGEMYADGVLATVDVSRLAKAHICVYEEMKKTSVGRYICFDRRLESQEETEKLARETGIGIDITRDVSVNCPMRFQLSNLKLSMLMSRISRCNEP